MPLPPAPRRGGPDRGWRSPGRSAGRSRCHAPEDAPGRDRVLRRSAAFVPATSAGHIDGTVRRFRRRAVPSERCRARRDWLRERVPVGVGRDVVPVRQPQFADQRLGGRTSDRHHGGDRIVGYPSDAVSGPGAERELSSSPTRLRPQLRVRRWPSQHGRRLSSIRAELDQQFEIADRHDSRRSNTVPHAVAALRLGTQTFDLRRELNLRARRLACLAKDAGSTLLVRQGSPPLDLASDVPGETPAMAIAYFTNAPAAGQVVHNHMITAGTAFQTSWPAGR